MARPFYPKESKSTLVLVLGIISVVLCGPFTGIAAIILGHSAIKNIKLGITDPSDKTLIQTGIVLGYVGSIWFVLWIIIDVWFF